MFLPKEDKSMKILLFGPQGSGKSTQGKLLATYLSIPYISTGDIFRAIASEQSAEGDKVRTILTNGKLVDDATTSDLVKKQLAQTRFNSGFIMDGYPRTIEQVNLYEPEFDIVIYLDAPKDVLVERLLSRGRTDDAKEAIEERLTHYFNLTEPLLIYYQKKGILQKINGIGEIDEIQKRVRDLISQTK